MMRIGADMPVPGKMFADRGHAAFVQPLYQCARQINDCERIRMQRAVANHGARAAVDIKHRGKAQIDSVRLQFRRDHEADMMRDMSCVILIDVPQSPEFAHRREQREMLPEPLHAAALMVDGNDQRRTAQPMNFGGQLHKLLGCGVIAGKKDDSAGKRMQQPAAVLCRKAGAGHVEHDRPERHRLPAHAPSSTTQAQARLDSSLMVR